MSDISLTEPDAPAREFLIPGNNIYAHITTPVFFVVGSMDNVVDNRTTRQIYERVLERESQNENLGNKDTTKWIEIKDLEHGPNSNLLKLNQVADLVG